MLKRIRLALLLAAVLAVPAVSHAGSITFAAGVSQIVEGPSTYTFTFAAPVVPGLYTSATSIGSLTLTPGPSGEATVDVSAVHPTYISGTGFFGAVSTNLGVDQGTAPCVAIRGLPMTCDFPLLSNSFALTFFDSMQAQLTFQLTGAGAVVAWNSTVTLDQSSSSVPEPATALLFGMGALAAARARRRR